jgi:acetolactate synthase-1/2/3 large subunit
VYFPQVEVIGDIGRSLTQLADRIEGAVPNAAALLPLRATILEHLADRAEEAGSPRSGWCTTCAR